MGTITVHEFITLDGVIDTPSWTFDYPFDPKMGEAIAGLMGRSGRFSAFETVPSETPARSATSRMLTPTCHPRVERLAGPADHQFRLEDNLAVLVCFPAERLV